MLLPSCLKYTCANQWKTIGKPALFCELVLEEGVYGRVLITVLGRVGRDGRTSRTTAAVITTTSIPVSSQSGARIKGTKRTTSDGVQLDGSRETMASAQERGRVVTRSNSVVKRGQKGSISC